MKNMNHRIIPFETILNCRDLGGLQNREGRAILPGLLLRSANLSEATEKDVEKLRREHRLARIVDLRTGKEREERPDVSFSGAEQLPIPIFDERMAGISHEKEGDTQLRLPVMEDLYRVMVTDEGCRANLGQALRAVMEYDFDRGSVLWHCTEGKDRCGLVSALLLSALSVDREQIMEDYLLTNLVNEPKAEGYYRGVLASGRPEAEARAARDVFLAKASYLETAFAAIDREYESMESYLTDGLFIPASVVDAFRERALSKV